MLSVEVIMDLITRYLAVEAAHQHCIVTAWWRHQMETFSALLALCAGNSPASGEFPAQRPVTRSFDVFFDLCLNKRLRKQSWGWWFETLSSLLWRHCNGLHSISQRRDISIMTFQTIDNATKRLRGCLSDRKCQDDVYLKWKHWSTM